MSIALETTPKNGTAANSAAGGPITVPAKRVAELNTAAVGNVSDTDVSEIVDKLLRMAKAGNVAAAKEVLDRTLGKPKQHVDLEAIVASLNAKEKPLDKSGKLQQMIDFYAKLMVPKQGWIPDYLVRYEEWRKGNNIESRPADWERLVKRVETRCNWIWVTPEAAANDWRLGCTIYDGKELKMDGSRRQYCGCEDDEQH